MGERGRNERDTFHTRTFIKLYARMYSQHNETYTGKAVNDHARIQANKRKKKHYNRI